MTVIDEFLSRYVREYDYYQEAAKLCAQQCEEFLDPTIRAIVSFRAKRPDRLRQKVEERHKDENYQSVEDIYNDLVDLAGVRIALYFPGDIDEVDRIIKSKFLLEKAKEFPRDSGEPKYEKRFSGYAARHFRVFLKEEDLPEVKKRFSDARIEIQVASVLIHAWSEVEHDLVYKPFSGTLSDDEYAILDELNGLVLAGEIALERLQKSAQRRINSGNQNFNNHFEVAAYIYEKITKSE